MKLKKDWKLFQLIHNEVVDKEENEENGVNMFGMLNKNIPLYEKLVGTMLFGLYYWFFSIMLNVSAVWRCEKGADNLYYNYHLPFVTCSMQDVDYLIMLIVSILLTVLFVVAVFVLFIYMLGKSRDSVDSSSSNKVGFLYENYLQKYYWFEIMWILRRILIAVVWSIATPVEQALFIVFILLLFIFMNLSFQPFIYKAESYLEFLTSASLIIEYIGTVFVNLEEELINSTSSQMVTLIVQANISNTSVLNSFKIIYIHCSNSCTSFHCFIVDLFSILCSLFLQEKR